MNQEEKTLDECCSFEHKWKIARGHISKSIRRTRLKFSPRESTTTITLCAKFNRNLRCMVLFRDFFGRSVVECPSCYVGMDNYKEIVFYGKYALLRLYFLYDFFSLFRLLATFRSDFHNWVVSLKGLTQLWKSRRIYQKYMPKCSVGSTDHVCKFLLNNFA